MGLVTISPEQMRTFSAEDIAYLEIQAELDFLSADKLTFEQFDYLVEGWNTLLTTSRIRIREACTAHDWVDLPYKPRNNEQARVCRYCVTYGVRDAV